MSITSFNFLRTAFEGQYSKVIEACIAGGVAGASLSYFKSKLSDPIGTIDCRLDRLIFLQTFDAEIPFLLTNLLYVVTLFVPSMISRTLLLAQYFDDMAACVQACATDASRVPGVIYICYVLSHRISRIISDLTVSFPYDSPSRLKVEDCAQKLYEYQAAMHAEVRGYVRLSMIS